VATEVNVTFRAQGHRTRVELFHGDWDRTRRKAKYGVHDFSSRWDPVLAAYVVHTAA
jgi:hypothetical protein